MTDVLLDFGKLLLFVLSEMFIHETFTAKYFQSVFKENYYVLETRLLSFVKRTRYNAHDIKQIFYSTRNLETRIRKIFLNIIHGFLESRIIKLQDQI